MKVTTAKNDVGTVTSERLADNRPFRQETDKRPGPKQETYELCSYIPTLPGFSLSSLLGTDAHAGTD